MFNQHSDDYQDFSYITNPFLGSTPRTLKKSPLLGISSLKTGICSGGPFASFVSLREMKGNTYSDVGMEISTSHFLIERM